MTKFFFICFFTLIIAKIDAQFLNSPSDSVWKKYSKELYLGVGGVQFLGDLGGQAGSGKKVGLGDMNLHTTSWEVHLGFRKQFHPLFATSSQFTYGYFEANDGYTTNFERSIRNLGVRSVLIDFSQRLEFIYFSKYKEKVKNEKIKKSRFQLYTFTGIGLVYFNPKGFFPSEASVSGDSYVFYGDDNWHQLRALRTEGQGYVNGSKRYKKISAVIPFGFGAQKSISQKSCIKLELTYVKTFTDYMDDVSSAPYYDYIGNGVPASPNQLYFSDPSWKQELTSSGKARGGKGNDCYFYASFSIVRALGLKEKKK